MGKSWKMSHAGHLVFHGVLFRRSSPLSIPHVSIQYFRSLEIKKPTDPAFYSRKFTSLSFQAPNSCKAMLPVQHAEHMERNARQGWATARRSTKLFVRERNCNKDYTSQTACIEVNMITPKSSWARHLNSLLTRVLWTRVPGVHRVVSLRPIPTQSLLDFPMIRPSYGYWITWALHPVPEI